MGRTFFITGASSGFGRALAQAALAAGHKVVGTVRDEQVRLLLGSDALTLVRDSWRNCRTSSAPGRR